MAHPVKEIELRRSSLILSLGIIGSRLFGLLREILMARWVGAGIVTDAFFVAFRIPNTLRNLIAEGGMTAAVTPVYSDLLSREAERRSFERRIFTAMRLFLFLLSAFGILTAPLWVHAFASGLPPLGYELAVRGSRWLFPMVYFFGLMGIAMAILQSQGAFLITAIGPILMNIGLILGTWLYTRPFSLPGIPFDALCLGALCGAILHWFSQYIALKRRRVDTRWELHLQDPGLKEVFLMMVPATGGFAIYQLSLILSTQFASYLPQGGVSHLNYADRIVQLPLALIGTATGSVSLALFSKLREQRDTIPQVLKQTLEYVTFLAFLAVGFFAVFAHPLCELLYAHGSFPREELDRTVQALYGYLAGTLFASCQRVLLALFFSQKDRKTPLVTSLIAVIIQGVSSYLLLPWDTFGVALASSIGTILQTLSLYLILSLRGLAPPLDELKEIGKGALCAGIATLGGIGTSMLNGSSFFRILVGGIVMCALYLGSALLLRHPEAQRIPKTFKRILSS